MACENDPAEVAALNALQSTEVEVAKDVEILYSDSALVRVRITGPTMLNYLDRSEPKQEFPDGVVVEFFGPNMDVTSRLTARYALRAERQGEVLARDSVVWISNRGDKLETSELIWDERRQEVYSRKFAVITRPEEIIYGHGFTANQDFTNARIQQVEGVIAVDKPEEGEAAPAVPPVPEEGN